MLNRMMMAAMFRNDFRTTQADSEKAVDWFFETITKELANGGEVVVRGFGTIDTTVRKAGKGRNLSTGELIDYPARRRARIRSGKALIEALNP